MSASVSTDIENDLDDLTPDDLRRLRRVATRKRLQQQDFQRLRTWAVGIALRGYPLSDRQLAVIRHGGGEVSNTTLREAGIL